MNLSEALLHALEAHGAREIFGIPGDYALIPGQSRMVGAPEGTRGTVNRRPL